jgi:16S rRNA (cytidine1402-2'-O)-methyltransferase
MTQATDASGATAARPGHLYVVATPIGNLGDLSPRARAVLASVDRIAAEDTRTTGAMLAQFGVRTPLVALHEHNEDRIAADLVRDVAAGRSLALVSDAGTPLISDPGFAVVRAAREAGVPVIAVPGPSASIAALSISGLPTDSFVFVGFLPAKSGARRQRLQALCGETRTLVFYESSHRIADSVDDLEAVFGASRRACVARELTKLYEESRTATLAELRDWLAADANRQRGEFVIVVEGAAAAVSDAAQGERVLQLLLRELAPSAAARVAAEITGVPRKALYAAALRLSGHAADADENDDNSGP